MLKAKSAAISAAHSKDTPRAAARPEPNVLYFERRFTATSECFDQLAAERHFECWLQRNHDRHAGTSRPAKGGELA
jgi:hypothetical protein